MVSKDVENDTNPLGAQLKRARERVKMTQADVAAAADVHVNYYARLERGEVIPSVESLQKIMRALKITSLNITATD